MGALYGHTIIMSLLFIVIFAIAEMGYHFLKLKVEITRKFVHIASGILCLTFPYYIQNKWLVLVLTVNFFLLLVISVKFNFLKSINGVERKTYGSFLFPFTIFILYCFYEFTDLKIYYYLPLLIFALSDPIGALIGKKYPLKKYSLFGQFKSVGGSLAFLVSAVIICLIYFNLFPITETNTIVLTLIIALVSTITEGISFKGTDNITVPLVVALVMFLFL